MNTFDDFLYVKHAHILFIYSFQQALWIRCSYACLVEGNKDKKC